MAIALAAAMWIGVRVLLMMMLVLLASDSDRDIREQEEFIIISDLKSDAEHEDGQEKRAICKCHRCPDEEDQRAKRARSA